MAAGASHDAGATPDASWECFTPAGLRVLVVDDDKLCLKVISKMLQQCNYEGVRSSLLVDEVQAAKRRSARQVLRTGNWQAQNSMERAFLCQFILLYCDALLIRLGYLSVAVSAP